MHASLDDIPEENRVDEVVALLGRLRTGEVLSLTAQKDPSGLATQVLERAAGAYDRQAIHLARKKTPPWLLHFKRQQRP